MSGWKIVDRRTGVRMGVATYLSFRAAGQQIDRWQDRHERGGRPDITRDMLLNMQPEPEDRTE